MVTVTALPLCNTFAYFFFLFCPRRDDKHGDQVKNERNGLSVSHDGASRSQTDTTRSWADVNVSGPGERAEGRLLPK